MIQIFDLNPFGYPASANRALALSISTVQAFASSLCPNTFGPISELAFVADPLYTVEMISSTLIADAIACLTLTSLNGAFLVLNPM